MSLSYLQVAVPASGAAPAFVEVTPGRTVEEVTVVITAAVLVQDVPHLRLEERHVHIDGYNLRETHAPLILITENVYKYSGGTVHTPLSYTQC